MINLISDITFLSCVEHVITTFLICGVFVDICLLVLQKTIATALVTTRLDYCNSLFNIIAMKDIKTLSPYY